MSADGRLDLRRLSGSRAAKGSIPAWDGGRWKPVPPGLETVNVVAASGAAVTLPDPAVASISRVTLTANCTFTFPTPAAGKSFTLTLVQDATGSRLATWPASVKWPGGTAPTLTTTATKADVISFMADDATNWRGFPAAFNF